jgi:hypothetical protein
MKAKTWAELTRRQRREVRELIRSDIHFHAGERYGSDPTFAEALRAALRELREPRREDDRG